MSTTYGIDPVTGKFTRKPATAILADMAAYQRANIDPTLKATNPASKVGILNASVVAELDAAWAELETIATKGFDPEIAEGRLLETLSKLTDTLRRAASSGTVPLSCTLTTGTTLLAGVHFAAITGKPDIRFTPVEDYEAPLDGAHDVLFQCERTGVVEAVAGSITTIATPVVGWTAVAQLEDVTPGHEIDDDPTLRERRRVELRRNGSSTLGAIRANVLASDKRIEDVLVRENDKDYVDPVTAMPPHSVSVIVDDGPTAPVPNDLIAQAVADSRAGGVTLIGNTSGNAIVDDAGTIKAVPFSRAVGRDVYVAVTVQKLSKGYPGDAAVAVAIAEAMNAAFGVGEGVPFSVVFSAPFTLQAEGVIAGIKKVVSVGLDFVPGPVATADLPIGALERARFDSTRVVVTSS